MDDPIVQITHYFVPNLYSGRTHQESPLRQKIVKNVSKIVTLDTPPEHVSTGSTPNTDQKIYGPLPIDFDDFTARIFQSIKPVSFYRQNLG